MPSQIAVCNLALTKLGADRITSLADDVKEAKELSAVYDILLKSELEKYRWAFAIKRASIAALADAPAWGYDLQYQLPDDCISLVQIDGADEVGYLSNIITESTAPYMVEGRQILTDLTAPLSIKYVSLVEDPNQWASVFVDAFATRLAFEVCEAVTQNNAKKATLWAEYQQHIGAARQMSAIQDPPMTIPDDTWLQSRG